MCSSPLVIHSVVGMTKKVLLDLSAPVFKDSTHKNKMYSPVAGSQPHQENLSLILSPPLYIYLPVSFSVSQSLSPSPSLSLILYLSFILSLPLYLSLVLSLLLYISRTHSLFPVLFISLSFSLVQLLSPSHSFCLSSYL